jgi:hypothetical protein
VSEPAAKRAPTIPILFFAAIDILVAFFLLVDGGFTVHFWLVGAIGLALAGLGLVSVYRRPE